jgi:hypothetical protein
VVGAAGGDAVVVARCDGDVSSSPVPHAGSAIAIAIALNTVPGRDAIMLPEVDLPLTPCPQAKPQAASGGALAEHAECPVSAHRRNRATSAEHASASPSLMGRRQ